MSNTPGLLDDELEALCSNSFFDKLESLTRQKLVLYKQYYDQRVGSPEIKAGSIRHIQQTEDQTICKSVIYWMNEGKETIKND